MTSSRTRRVLAMSALTLALGACGDSTGSDDEDRGTLSFSYSGASSGQFDAAGEFRPNSTSLDFAGAFVEDGDLVLVGSERTGNDVADFFVAVAPAQERTTSCTASTAFTDCDLFAGLALGLNARTEEFDRSYSGFVGTLTVTDLTSDRARGSFSFNLVDDESAGTNPPVVQVRSGTFDVPVLEEDDLNALVPTVGLRALRTPRP